MATLKIETIHDNTIWLTEVTSVETLVHAYANEFPEDFTAWQVLQGSIDRLRSENLKERISALMVSYCNFDKAVDAGKIGVPSHTVLVKVDFMNQDAQIWLLASGQNYLMVEGKTIDRI